MFWGTPKCPKIDVFEVILEHPFWGVWPLVGGCAHNVPIRSYKIWGGANTPPEVSKRCPKPCQKPWFSWILTWFLSTPGSIIGHFLGWKKGPEVSILANMALNRHVLPRRFLATKSVNPVLPKMAKSAILGVLQKTPFFSTFLGPPKPPNNRWGSLMIFGRIANTAKRCSKRCHFGGR